ncbi:hypothetical protein PIB30_002134 [Stylosanthes scabra]|uniref:Protein phosphatase n=1 Tax=Stylosanthes scabra TaxID=79078 RepID=A0ABU6R2Z4_9FABA|nr:hypothetical protein [Stylosanthes scabra]
MTLMFLSRIGSAIQSSNVGIGGGTISSNVGKLLISTTKVSHPVNFESCTYLVRQRRTLSVIGTPCIGSALASWLSGAAISECSEDKLASRKIMSNLCLWTSLETGRKLGMKSSWQPDYRAIYGCLIAARTLYTSYLCTELGSRGLHSSSSCSIAGPAPGVNRDTCACKENSTSSSNSSEQKAPLGKTLKLESGSCYLPHPDKEETGGEDAHFICSEAQAVGLADGVGGWADLGVDAGQYSRELMSNSVAAILGEPKGSIDPAKVLEKAYLSTKAKGSSTACIITLTDQSSPLKIHGASTTFITIRAKDSVPLSKGRASHRIGGVGDEVGGAGAGGGDTDAQRSEEPPRPQRCRLFHSGVDFAVNGGARDGLVDLHRRAAGVAKDGGYAFTYDPEPRRGCCALGWRWMEWWCWWRLGVEKGQAAC